MKLNKLVSTFLISATFALSPAVSKAKDDISNEVFQLVGNTLISTNLEYINEGKVGFYDCRMVSGYKIFLSNKEDIIGSSSYSLIDAKKIEVIKSSPQCDLGEKSL